MSGPFSPSETRYEDNACSWIPEVGSTSAANGREKDEACVLYERVSVQRNEDEGDGYIAIEDLLLSNFPKGEHREMRLRAWYASNGDEPKARNHVEKLSSDRLFLLKAPQKADANAALLAQAKRGEPKDLQEIARVLDCRFDDAALWYYGQHKASRQYRECKNARLNARPPPVVLLEDSDSEEPAIVSTPPKKRQRLHTAKKASSRPLRQLAAYVASLGGDSELITKTWAAREARGGGGAKAYRAPDGATYRSRAAVARSLGLTPPARGRRKPDLLEVAEPGVVFDDSIPTPAERLHDEASFVKAVPCIVSNALARPPFQALASSRGRAIRFRGRQWFAGDCEGASRHCSVDVQQLECVDRHLVHATPQSWSVEASAICEGRVPDASNAKRDRYGRKPVKVRRKDGEWRQFASCRDALRSTPGLTSYVLSALVNGKLGREGLQLEDFEASFVEDAADDDGAFRPTLLPASVHDIPAIPAVLPLPGTLIEVGGRTCYAPRQGETLKDVAGALYGVANGAGRTGLPSLSEGGSGPEDLLWLAQLDWSDAVYQEGRLILLPDAAEWPTIPVNDQAFVPPHWPVPETAGVDVEASGYRWVHASVLFKLFPEVREALDGRDAARCLDTDPRLFRRLNSNALDSEGRVTSLSDWLVAPERLRPPCALCRCRGEWRAWRCRVERRHVAPPFDDVTARALGARVKVRCVDKEAVTWRPALLVGDAIDTTRRVAFVGGAEESVEEDRLCYIGASPFRAPAAKEKACAGRVVEVYLGGRAARARVTRVFVDVAEGPAHDEILCALVDDAEPSRERTVRVAELLRAVGTAQHVKWADDVAAEVSPPPAKRRRPARRASPIVAVVV